MTESKKELEEEMKAVTYQQTRVREVHCSEELASSCSTAVFGSQYDTTGKESFCTL